MTARSLLAVVLLPASVIAQTPATSYGLRYAEVMALAPRKDRVVVVSNLVLQRDVARFVLRSGTLALLGPVGGRTVGAVFRGEGTFSFTPPTEIEQARLERFEDKRALNETFHELVLLFTDSTDAELAQRLTFGSSEVPGALRSAVQKGLHYLGDEDSWSLNPDLMAGLLNAEATGTFYAHIERDDGGPLMLMIDPLEFEAVSLARRAPRKAWTRDAEVFCRFALQEGPSQSPAPGEPGERVGGTPTITAYRIDATMKQTLSGDLSFAARAGLDITTPTDVGPWVPLLLFYKLEVDSARWEGDDPAEPANVFRGKDADVLWVDLGRRLRPGESRPLLVYYHGDLIDRYGDFFFIKSSVTWYPRTLEDRSHATFDLTFHSPAQFVLASSGELGDSTEANHVLTTRWITSEPRRTASFNLGVFNPYQPVEPAVPPVTVLVSDDAHRRLFNQMRQEGQLLTQQAHMRETVGSDIVQSLKFFQKVYGPPAARQFRVTEVPDFHGEAFPGLVNLSWMTFQQTSLQGEDQVFRAHEVAHQWWGIGVDFVTYHDQWLSEGFSTFSGLWFLQTATKDKDKDKDKDKYFGMLRHWRADIMLHKSEPSPIWLGYRVQSSKDTSAYQILVYEKGAWVLHMLRVLMIDLQTVSEDRFTEMMRDFYRSYRGQHASTADFQRIVEQYTGMGMDWFFKQWVYGTGIPSYRVAYKTERVDNGKYRVHLRVTQDNVPDDFLMYVPVTVDFGGGREARLRVKVAGPLSEITLPLMPSEPKGLKFNALDGVLCDVDMVGW